MIDLASLHEETPDILIFQARATAETTFPCNLNDNPTTKLWNKCMRSAFIVGAVISHAKRTHVKLMKAIAEIARMRTENASTTEIMLGHNIDYYYAWIETDSFTMPKRSPDNEYAALGEITNQLVIAGDGMAYISIRTSVVPERIIKAFE